MLKKGKKFSSATLTILVIVLSSASIIGLWLYAEQTSNVRLAVFALSMAIVIAMVTFIDQIQKKWTNEIERAMGRAQAAELQAEQLNFQLQSSIDRANLMTQHAMEASRSKNEFLANMSHEIRIPMNAIIGFSEMLSEENLTDVQKKQIQIVRDSSRHLLHLINDILDFSNIEAGKLEVEISDCNVENILSAVESHMRSAAAQKNLKFEIIHGTSLPKFIRTDAAKLKQCLLNIVSNAIKFTDKGYVYIKTSWENSYENPFVRFEIEDSGVGISPERLYHIFEPFSRTDTLGSKDGSRLKLAITHHLAELLSGSLTVNSMPGKGTIFTLIVPTGRPAAALESCDDDDDDVEISIKPLVSADNRKFTGKVLVAEDSPTNQTLIELLLKKMGIEAEIVENGRLAVQKATEKKFDVILMDIQMPLMNGFQATRELRKKGNTVPIVALTACAMKGDDEKCFAAGCNDYLSKPLDRKKLIEILSKYLSAAAEPNPEPASTAPAEAQTVEKLEIDWQLLMERISSEELIDEIMPIFIKDNTERMKILSAAVEKTDVNEIKFYAHSLKGAAATIGAPEVSEIARQLELAARDADSSKYKPLFAELSVHFSRLMDFLSKSDWKQTARQASFRQHSQKS